MNVPLTVDGYEPIYRNEGTWEHNVDLDVLTDMERSVIVWMFGLFGEDEKTLTELGKQFRVTRERIRQIKLKALRRLRFHYKRKLNGKEDIYANTPN